MASASLTDKRSAAIRHRRLPAGIDPDRWLAENYPWAACGCARVRATSLLASPATPSPESEMAECFQALSDMPIWANLLSGRGRSLAFQPSSGFEGVVADDQIRPGALDRGQFFQDGRSFIQPSALACGLDHRIFAAGVIGHHRHFGEALAHPGDDIEIGQRRFDHQEIRPFLDIDRRLFEGFSGIGGIHLMATPIAEFRGPLGGVPKRAVKSRSVFHGVGHDRKMVKGLPIQGLANAGDHPVEHRARSHDIGAGQGVAQRNARENIDALVIEHIAIGKVGVPLAQKPAMPVVGIFADTNIGDDDEIGTGRFDT
uniref:Uncharacterized protein n=1 Tax=Amphimedon queenslandica TaxID=400682 RepID=A0A1X7ST66_AMPQE